MIYVLTMDTLNGVKIVKKETKNIKITMFLKNEKVEKHLNLKLSLELKYASSPCESNLVRGCDISAGVLYEDVYFC